GAAWETGGMITTVQVFSGMTLLAQQTNPGTNFSIVLSNLPAGEFRFTAVATDSKQVSATSEEVQVSIVTPVQTTLSAPQLLSSGAFQFSYQANPGLSYKVMWTGDFRGWQPVVTNTATSNVVTVVVDANSTNRSGMCRVVRLPNP